MVFAIFSSVLCFSCVNEVIVNGMRTKRLIITAVLMVVAALLAVPVTSGAKKAQKEAVYHTVSKGDTIGSISAKYKVDVDVLMRLNGISDPRRLRIDQKIEIPPSGMAGGITHTVKPGDSLAEIARHYGVGIRALAEENNIRTNSPIRIGDELRIPAELRKGASRGHIVRKGDTISSIAKRYKVSQKSLMRTNDIKSPRDLTPGRTLAIPDPGLDDDNDDGGSYRPPPRPKAIKSGTKVKGGVRHILQPGQNLWILGRAYGVGANRIKAANKRLVGKTLQPGTTVFIPGATEVVPVRIGKWTYLPVKFVRNATGESAKLRLLNSKGRIIPVSRQKLSYLARPKRSKKRKLLHTRLVRMLQRVADRFPGHTIEIISGYRVPKKWPPKSRHELGRAMDLRVRGIPNRQLFSFIKTLPNVGAGYYPNSTFVHMDVRNSNVVWTDRAGPGEDPVYVRRSKAGGTSHDPEPTGEVEKDLPEAEEPDEDDIPE